MKSNRLRKGNMPRIENREGIITVLDECGKPFVQMPINAHDDLNALAAMLRKFEYYPALEQLECERRAHRAMVDGFVMALSTVGV